MTTPAKPTHIEIYRLLSELSAKVDSLVDAVGEEMTGDDGKVFGTGLTGRIIRTEAKVHAYDLLKQRAIGAFMMLTLSLTILWWLTKDRWAEMFKVSG
jgi:hypothetical protein